MNISKSVMGRVLLFFAVVTGLISFWYTLEFTWTPEFRAPALPAGPTHTNYHAFREAMLALAVNLLVIRVGVVGTALKFEAWATTLFMAIFYYSSWWLAWPLWGFHAPSIAAELNHVVATVCGLAGLMVLKPQRRGELAA